MNTKKIIALIISAIMVFSVIPMAVFAAGNTSITTTLPTEAKVGEQIDFSVTTNTAAPDAGTMVLGKFSVSDPTAVSTEYKETAGAGAGQWLPLTGDTFGPATGFPLMNGATSEFRSTFNKAGTYTVTIQIVKADDQTPLATYEHTITVTDVVEPTVTVDMPETFVIGQPTAFAITTTGGDKAGTLVLGKSTFSGTAAIEKIEYYEVNDGQWYELTGDFGPPGGFPLGDATSYFRVTFKEAGTFSLTVQIVDAADGTTVLADEIATISSEAEADYSKVDAAIEHANSLNRDDYVDFTEVDNTIDAVVRGLGVSNQADVDAMAQRIEDAIAALQLKETTAGTSYQIIEGANATWNKGNTNGLTVKSNGDFAKFTGVKVDGVEVAAENYTAVSGSTVVTLNAAYLETLAEGTHTLTLVYTDGEVATEFTIAPQAANTNAMNSPQTGDNSNTVMWIVVAVVAAGAMAGTVLFARKKKAE